MSLGAAVEFERGDLARHAEDWNLTPTSSCVPSLSGLRRRVGRAEQAHGSRSRRQHGEADIGRSRAAASVRDRVAEARRTGIAGVGREGDGVVLRIGLRVERDVPWVSALTPVMVRPSPSGSLSLAIKDAAAIGYWRVARRGQPDVVHGHRRHGWRVDGLNMTSTQKFVAWKVSVGNRLVLP